LKVKFLLDINVMFDVFEERVPYNYYAEQLLDGAISGLVDTVVPAHALTTLFYVIRRHSGHARASRVVGEVIATFPIAPASQATFQAAHQLGWKDFEDAVVAVMAEAEACDYIVSRNLGDFVQAKIPAIPPEAALRLLRGQA